MYTKAKMWAAAIGGTCTAVSVAITTVQLVLGDGKIEAGEITTLITTGVTLVSTVYAVWKTRNQPIGQVPNAE